MGIDMKGKVVLLTGGTEGIGKAAALELAKAGASLVLTARSREKGERVVAELKAASGNQDIGLLLGDLSSMAEVAAVAAAFRAGHDRLDLLVNNAGAFFFERLESADGLEMTFALNHMSYFLLTNLLLDLLRRTPGSRVVSTSSGAHRGSRMDVMKVAKRPGAYEGWPAYADSKLCNILFTRELARRLEGSGVAVSCFHPGFVRSGFAMNNTGWMAKGWKLFADLFGRTPEQGAETLLWLATSPEAAEARGGYYDAKALTQPRPLGRDDRLAAELWALSEQLAAPWLSEARS